MKKNVKRTNLMIENLLIDFDLKAKKKKTFVEIEIEIEEKIRQSNQIAFEFFAFSN